MSIYDVLFQVGLFAMCLSGFVFFAAFTIGFLFTEVMPTFANIAARCIRPLLFSTAWTLAAAILGSVVTP